MEQDTQGLDMMEQGIFRIKNLDNINHLAGMLSNICPKPAMVLQGLLELLTNAVEHGSLGITYDEKTDLIKEGQLFKEWERHLQLPENQRKVVKVEYSKTNEMIQITIQDEGKGFDYHQYLEFDKDRLFDNHGRGIAMSKSHYFDEIEYLGNGNTVKTIIRL